MTKNWYNGQSGFRLARMEIYNWGTFDGQIYMLRPDGQTAVLTGANGSGKSTLADAMLTMFIEGRKRNYNLASGGAGSARERNERTYIRGQYSRARGDSALDARANTLRGSNDHTVLLLSFADPHNERIVTLAQIMWISNADRVEKRYYVANTDLTIEQHFPQRHVTQKDLPQGAKLYSSFSDYSTAMRKALGLGGRPKAIDLFNQTVAVKEIVSLNQFVRDHMLDKGDPEARVDALRAQYRELNDAHAAIQRAEYQLSILGPLVEAAQSYRHYEQQITEYDAARGLVPYYIAEQAQALLTGAIQADESKLQAEQSRQQSVESELESLRDERENIRIAIANDSVGQMKREIEAEIKPLNGQIDALKRAATRYDGYAAALDLPVYRDESDFYENRTQAQDLIQQNQTDIQALDADRTQTQSDQRDLQRRAAELDDEIAYLRQNPSQIPQHVARIREQISQALNVPADEMPFIGELIQVRDDQGDWQGALERLLHSFAQELIIPESAYASASRFIDQHRLRGRLVYRRVDAARRVPHREAAENAHDLPLAYEKLQIHPETPYHDWVAASLRQSLTHACCDTLEQLAAVERGITQQGQIKHNRTRHEKDDRYDIHDRKRYVLGWDNRAKLRQLETERDDLTRQLDKLTARLRELDSTLERRRKDISTLENLLSYAHFSDIDWRSRQNELDRKQAQLRELEAQAQQLRELEQKEAQLKRQIQEADARRNQVLATITTLQNRIADYQTRLQDARAQLHSATDETQRLWDKIGHIVTDADKEPLTLAALATRTAELQTSLQRSIGNFRGQQNRAEAVILDAMNTFKRDYPDEGAALTAQVQALAAYEAIHERLQRDDLPRHKDRFKQMLDRDVTRSVINFSTSLEQQERDIERSIEELNESLAQVDYGSNTTIRLLAEPSRDAEINEFRRDLRACIPDAGDNSPAELERAYQRIKALIQRFDDDPNWMRRVIDVRRWRTFAAEQVTQDGRQIDYYSDSSGKSGGQKAKLAYTILASAIAHQYGLQDAVASERSFRFVVVDEAFSKLDDDNARYAMQLFAQLGLQLLVVTPMAKLNVIEDYVLAYHLVVNNAEGNNSRVFNLTQAEYREQRRLLQAEAGHGAEA